MTGPTGLIFALRAKYATQDGAEALFSEPDFTFSGSTSATGGVGITHGASGTDGDPIGLAASRDGASADGPAAAYSGASVQGGLSTAQAETLGASGSDVFPEMAFSIERTAVEAKTRALKAEYTTELAQDLKAVHGLDAETELANILSNEIMLEINR
ncbi:hypothetical protein, partial [Staphylococcus haemolyticus]|uniref:hypothetical protein n=1 Tax=Staphylococcus haemolyticus TaxID=1283 RepID=UPI001C5CBF19